jgi:hypothetical protein
MYNHPDCPASGVEQHHGAPFQPCFFPDLLQVFGKSIRKSALSGYQESSSTLVTALLTSGVGALVAVIGPHHLLQDEVVALREAKPQKKATMEMACLTNQ